MGKASRTANTIDLLKRETGTQGTAISRFSFVTWVWTSPCNNKPCMKGKKRTFVSLVWHDISLVEMGLTSVTFLIETRDQLNSSECPRRWISFGCTMHSLEVNRSEARLRISIVSQMGECVSEARRRVDPNPFCKWMSSEHKRSIPIVLTLFCADPRRTFAMSVYSHANFAVTLCITPWIR